MENLSAAALLGLLALLVAAASLVLDSSSERKERAELQTFVSSRIGDAEVRSDSPGWRRIYEVNRHGKRLYAAIVTIGDSRGLVRAAAFVSPEGRLDSIEALQVVPQDAPYSRDGWFADFLGKGGDSPFPSARSDSRRPEAISGATESYLITAEALGSLSQEIIQRGGSKAAGGQ